MKKIYTIRWSETSERDLKSIIEYLAKDSPSRAYEVFSNIREKASNLHSFPGRGRVVPELQDQGITQYRELIIAQWRIVYRISEGTVYVVSVLDSRQNVEDLLLKRLLGLQM
ncbi:MAG: plasmid stabilization protein [Deltaproteobacteria bacterium RIFOXYA12_FULL_61_11]|nr:MAG: plasmid stabilization protein [Deltaproteobacteria bacterium RIFOXYA12_FULL_61_11]